MTVKERLGKFIDEKGLTRRAFYRAAGLPNGFLDKGENFGTDLLEKIYCTYPELNMVWLVTGQGQMLQEIAPNSAPNAAPNAENQAQKDLVDSDNEDLTDYLPTEPGAVPASHRNGTERPESAINEVLDRVKRMEIDILLLKKKWLNQV